MPAKIFGLAAFFILPACAEQRPPVTQNNERPVADTTITFARRFAIAHGDAATWVYLKGNRQNNDTTAVFVLLRDTLVPEGFRNGKFYIHVPCRRIASLSSIYTQMFYELGALDAVKAIDNSDYVINPATLQKLTDEKLPELARTPEIDIEQTLLLQPDIVFTYGMGDGSATDPRLAAAGIPVAVSLDHLEESPLARAEWIRFFAEFVGKRKEADSIFGEVKQRYDQLRGETAHISRRPTVLSDIRYSDAWYVPGGRSYVATLIRDAGGQYIWETDSHAGSLPLSFEEVYTRAHNAEHWINLSMVGSREELLSFERRYALFDAYKNGNLYNNNKNVNKKGYSDYWESGMIHPDRILHDLFTIFHNDTARQKTLFYYRQLR